MGAGAGLPWLKPGSERGAPAEARASLRRETQCGGDPQITPGGSRCRQHQCFRRRGNPRRGEEREEKRREQKYDKIRDDIRQAYREDSKQLENVFDRVDKITDKAKFYFRPGGPNWQHVDFKTKNYFDDYYDKSLETFKWVKTDIDLY